MKKKVKPVSGQWPIQLAYPCFCNLYILSERETLYKFIVFLQRTQHHQVWLQLQIVRNSEREQKVLQFAKASHRLNLLKIEANLNYLSKNNQVNAYLSVQSHSAPSCRNHLVKLA